VKNRLVAVCAIKKPVPVRTKFPPLGGGGESWGRGTPQTFKTEQNPDRDEKKNGEGERTRTACVRRPLREATCTRLSTSLKEIKSRRFGLRGEQQKRKKRGRKSNGPLEGAYGGLCGAPSVLIDLNVLLRRSPPDHSTENTGEKRGKRGRGEMGT